MHWLPFQRTQGSKPSTPLVNHNPLAPRDPTRSCDLHTDIYAGKTSTLHCSCRKAPKLNGLQLPLAPDSDLTPLLSAGTVGTGNRTLVLCKNSQRCLSLSNQSLHLLTWYFWVKRCFIFGLCFSIKLCFT